MTIVPVSPTIIQELYKPLNNGHKKEPKWPVQELCRTICGFGLSENSLIKPGNIGFLAFLSRKQEKLDFDFRSI